ncbi:MarR family transcriptional regulator [Dethiosulfatarculus sandiegensis]|uniref:MarR family transcriptional regulator n=1 Tax=Dethiosulfatarculus sandiegensis TaxID=1429043 RepID=A0A0D2J6I5_9BACT|nr:MarR family transcriptional regulator [Dethiosulfatarculus sandiegensis]KIX13769.1 MarR family transcriptional regulator [Dethiosulfatarculus sandiegensis]
MCADTKATLSEDAKAVLKTLAESDAPLANKQIATISGLDGKQVTATVKKLKTQGLVDSPARCKYGITQEGKDNLPG